MKIYNLSPATGEFLGEGYADESPLEPGVWHLPAWSVKKVPPEVGERQVAVYKEGKWSITDDWRGYQYWVEGSCIVRIVSEIGVKPPEGHLTEKPPLSRGEIETLRVTAYADPLTGSDRMFSEAARMQLMEEEGFAAVRSKAVSRFAEIQALYPWPSIE